MGELPSARKVLHITTEMAPFAKEGGLGDVMGSLPKAMRAVGVDARVLMPAFPGVLESAAKHGYPVTRLPDKVYVAIDWRVYSASVLQADVGGLVVYLLEQPELYSNPRIYPMALNLETVMPFAFLSMAGLELPGATGWKPDIMHVHDWFTSILPIALRWHRHYSAMRPDYDVVLTVHNLSYQGVIEQSVLSAWGLTSEAFSMDTMEFYGQANILKGGIITADAITTVSPRYSWDIQTPDGGFGLHGLFSSLRGKLTGILNGIDYDIWRPDIDDELPAKYGADDMSGKALCRERLLERCGWADDGRPIALFVGRLVQQKGVDILFTALERMLGESCRAVVIGSGLSQYEDWARELAALYPENFWCFIGFGEDIAHLAYAGADILLMPSLFEPCGLSQMIAMAYGTIPVVRNTGGLSDSVIDFDGSPDGTGFIFSDYTAEELAQAAYRAIDAFDDKDRWAVVTRNAMTSDFSWAASTAAYIKLYDNLISGNLLT
ncbi:MAG: glycogen synthase [Synergistaceae bacterium]|jgi:starch synthase|nr:glycogen synthase [Synergistaceae bacterium]